MSSFWTRKIAVLPHTVRNADKLVRSERTTVNAVTAALQLNAMCAFVVLEANSSCLVNVRDVDRQAGLFVGIDESGCVVVTF